jgi:hypothetical protein
MAMSMLLMKAYIYFLFGCLFSESQVYYVLLTCYKEWYFGRGCCVFDCMLDEIVLHHFVSFHGLLFCPALGS